MYCKLFASLYQGTLRGRANEILVFTNLIAHADAAGHVDKHWNAIAQEVGLPVDDVKAALDALESEDLESRSPEHKGRRIIRLDEHRAWGWKIVNHGKYRAIRSEEDRREQNRLAQERWRKKSAAVSRVSRRKPPSAQAEAEAEEEAEEVQYNVGLAPDGACLEGSKEGEGPALAPSRFRLAARGILDYFNAAAGRSFRSVDANLNPICQRLAEEGVTFEGVKTMIDRQVKLWRGTEMERYLRPETLFNRTKFASYFDDRNQPLNGAPRQKSLLEKESEAALAQARKLERR